MFQPSYSDAGGVGFYIKESINYSVHDDLTISKSEFEALWIEIQNDSQRNMLCGIINRQCWWQCRYFSKLFKQ